MTDTVAGLIVIVVFATWWLLTLLFQLNPLWLRRIKRRDIFHLLPKWTFFAPHPKMHDYNFLYRDARRDGSLGEWVDVTIGYGHPFTKWLWNPRKRLTKGLGDGLRRERSLNQLLMLGVRPEIMTAYRRLHHFFWRQPIAADSAARQFIVTKTVGHLDLGIEPTTVLLSDFHLLERSRRVPRYPR